MIEQTLDIKTAAGEMETFICRPERGGPFPAVFFADGRSGHSRRAQGHGSPSWHGGL